MPWDRRMAVLVSAEIDEAMSEPMEDHFVTILRRDFLSVVVVINYTSATIEEGLLLLIRLLIMLALSWDRWPRDGR